MGPTTADTPPRGESDRLDSIEKKESISHNEYASSDPSGLEGQDGKVDIDHGIDPVLLKRIIRKVDWRLVPTLAAMYCVSLIDRTNSSYARQANNMWMDTELGTKYGNRYSIITAVFFIPYIISEIPSQFGLRRFGARIWLGGAVVIWGIIESCMGFVTTWSQLAGLRAALGAFEAALFPGATYLSACWYPRRQMASRTAFFYISSAFVASCTTPLGYAYGLLHRKGNLSGWAWMFVFSGILTIIVGLIGFIFLTDVPNKAKFLTEEERAIVNLRIERDRADSVDDPITWAKVGRYLADWKLWGYGIAFCANNSLTYSQAYFLPVILKSMGFDYVGQMLLGTPTYAWAIIPSIVCARIADNYRGMRAPMVMFNTACAIAGTAMFSKLSMDQKAARYAGVFSAVGGANANVGLIISWSQTSLRQQSKRAVSSASIILWGGIGGILAAVTMLQKEAAIGYPTGINFCLGMNACVFVGAGLLSSYYRIRNRQADQGKVVLENDENFRYQP